MNSLVLQVLTKFWPVDRNICILLIRTCLRLKLKRLMSLRKFLLKRIFDPKINVILIFLPFAEKKITNDD